MKWLVLFAAIWSASGSAESLSFDRQNLGENFQFSKISVSVKMSNYGTKPVHSIAISPLSPDDKVFTWPLELAAGASGNVSLQIDAGDDLGNRLHSFRVTSDGQTTDEFFSISNFGVSLLDKVRPELDFGVVKAGTASVWKSVDLTSHQFLGVLIASIDSVPDFILARLSADNHAVEFSVKPDASWGYHVGQVKVQLGSSQQPAAVIVVRADVHGTVVPSENPIALGLIRQGQKNEHLVRLTSADGKSFRTGAATIKGFTGVVSLRNCTPAAPGCQLLAIVVEDNQPTGKLSGQVLVTFPDLHRSLSLDVWGVLMKADANVIPLALTHASGDDSGKPSGAHITDLKSTLATATRRVPVVDTPAGAGPLLKWNVANERELHGYFVYRGASEAGPFERVGKRAILVSSPDGISSSLYQWRDESATAGVTYWYYIAALYSDGHMQPLTGPQKVVAK